MDQRGIYIKQNSHRITTEDAMGSVGHQRPEIHLRAAQSFLGRAQCGVKRANEQGKDNEERQMDDGLLVISRGMLARQREICAYGEGEGGRYEARLPTSVPGADHDRDRKNHEPAFHHVREEESGDQGENDAEDGDSIAQDRGPGRRNVEPAKKGEFQSH